MLPIQFSAVLYLGVLAVQVKPQLQNFELKAPIDTVVRELEDLNREATTELQQAIDRLRGELRSLDEISGEILRNLGDELRRDVATLSIDISSLQERALKLGVDIRECVSDSLDEILNLSQQLIVESGMCFNLGYAQVEGALNDGIRKIEQAIGPIEEYWREVERCRQAGRFDQEICVAELTAKIGNDRAQVPNVVQLVVEEVTGQLEAERASLLLCAADKPNILNEEGGRIVRRVTECAERKFPPVPTLFK